jgi:putative tricarboxylic transport membrane protein
MPAMDVYPEMVPLVKKNGVISGFFWLTLSMAICAESIRTRLGTLREPGPGFTTFLGGSLLGILGVVMVISSFYKRARTAEVIEKDLGRKETWKGFRHQVLILLSLFGCALILEPLGFVLSTFIFLFFLFKLSEPGKWLRPFIYSAIAVISCYSFFYILLQCPLPRGVLRLG